MLTTLPYADDATEQTTIVGSSLPPLSNILFPDFENTLLAPTDTPATEQFTVDSPSKASWAVSRILEAEARMDQRSALANEYKARIDAWLESANQQDSDSIFYLSLLLEPYAKAEISKLHKSRTLSLPTGLASLRKLPDRLEITDSAAALAYCEAEHPEAVIIKKELDKSILKELILKQAEPIPGVDAELGPDKLYVKPLRLKAA
ncbi:hypothetical protein FACS1894137_07210 [Spirochaetia bacterium]|nr:hypothetical protein FACS1894137_07210 [Spirochaetia bacterium]